MFRDQHEDHRGPEQNERRDNHFEHRPNGMSGHEYNQGFQSMMRAEQHMFKQLEHDLIKSGCLPPNPFMNGFDNDCGQQQQQQGQNGGDSFVDGIKKVVGIAAKIVPFL